MKLEAKIKKFIPNTEYKPYRVQLLAFRLPEISK